MPQPMPPRDPSRTRPPDAGPQHRSTNILATRTLCISNRRLPARGTVHSHVLNTVDGKVFLPRWGKDLFPPAVSSVSKGPVIRISQRMARTPSPAAATGVSASNIRGGGVVWHPCGHVRPKTMTVRGRPDDTGRHDRRGPRAEALGLHAGGDP